MSCNLVKANWRLGGTCRLSLLDVYFKLVSCLTYFSVLMMEATCSSNMSLHFNLTTCRYYLKQNSSYLLLWEPQTSFVNPSRKNICLFWIFSQYFYEDYSESDVCWSVNKTSSGRKSIWYKNTHILRLHRKIYRLNTGTCVRKLVYVCRCQRGLRQRAVTFDTFRQFPIIAEAMWSHTDL